jgi:hypothetical protein
MGLDELLGKGKGHKRECGPCLRIKDDPGSWGFSIFKSQSFSGHPWLMRIILTTCVRDQWDHGLRPARNNLHENDLVEWLK